MRITNETLDPVALRYRRGRRRFWCYVFIAIYLIGIATYWGILAEAPYDEGNPADQFKYGSIGSDSDNGLPYWIWRVLPEMFPKYLPNEQAFLALPEDERTGLAGYAQFGFVIEPTRDRPIGFSKRRDLVDRVGLNCAVCHVGTVRQGKNAKSIYAGHVNQFTADGKHIVVAGMPANTVDLQSYFRFLFNCANDARFTRENVLAHIEARRKLNVASRIFYQRAVPEVRDILITRSHQLDYFEHIPDFGPGRVDTFTPYKTMVFGFAYDDTVGTSDFPSVWNQRPREGMQLHWDGNNKSVIERNISASLGAGATPTSLDMPRLLKIAEWIGSPKPDPDRELSEEATRRLREQNIPQPTEMQIPKYPFEIDESLAEKGARIFQSKCAKCHDWTGESIGRTVGADEIGTDRRRLDSYTTELAVNQNTFGVGTWWRFKNFRKTNGYANMPLDGIWARAPYLHNGSVPTLRDLLAEPENRPHTFYRGDDRYDTHNVGFVSPAPTNDERPARKPNAAGQMLFLLDTTLPGNGNGGHAYGTDLADEQKDQLLEYLKTL